MIFIGSKNVVFICLLYARSDRRRRQFLEAKVLETCVVFDPFFLRLSFIVSSTGSMLAYGFCAAVGAVGLFLLLALLGWWIYIHISPFHVTVGRIPGPRFYLPLLGNILEVAGGLDRWDRTSSVIVVASKMASESKALIRSLWRSRRKLLTPAFHFSMLKNYFEVFNEQSRILSGIIGEMCKSFPGGKGEMDVYPYITRCSLDIICEASMGTRINAQTQDSDYDWTALSGEDAKAVAGTSLDVFTVGIGERAQSTVGDSSWVYRECDTGKAEDLKCERKRGKRNGHWN
ncbi:Uncharacterized protein APZ42_022387 [Daphnia magna]|uniref:Uncharacterized protein n=1 Tax=Daphnia magna TaxID=35525 RepID=A0A164VG23_9CRUS|nr:Uncharacterized protein APZ42_022387 [Daphnia magna]